MLVEKVKSMMQSKFHQRKWALNTGTDEKCHRNACVDVLFIGDTLVTYLFLEDFIVTSILHS